MLWDKTEADLVSIEYKARKKIVKLERKPEGYWWGTDTTIETKPKPKPKPGEGSGSAGSAARPARARRRSGSAGSGSRRPTAAAPIEEEEVGRKTHEFPLGEAGDKLIKDYTAARALRDLGVPNDEQKKDYKLVDSKTTITITFKDGPKTFLVGGSVYGGSDRYVVDQASGKAYVLSKDLISGLEVGESSLHLVDPRGFDAAKIERVAIEAGGRAKAGRARRRPAMPRASRSRRGAMPRPRSRTRSLANFIDNANNLKPTEYAASMTGQRLTPVMKLTYKDARGAMLGTLSLYKHEKPGELARRQELDPANPPKGEIEYYIMTEKTRVPALVRKDTAQRSENDLETCSATRAPPVGRRQRDSIDPHGNPFSAGLRPTRTAPCHRRRPGGARLAPVSLPPAPWTRARRGTADAMHCRTASLRCS